MDVEIQHRIREKYEGAYGRRWERIETGRGSTYFEQNATIGRRRVTDLLVERLDASASTRVLDGGCGMGTVARHLGDGGARVTGVDLVPRFVQRAVESHAGPAVEFVQGDFLEILRAGRGGDRFDALLLMEVLEDYGLPERRNLLEGIASAGVPRIFLVFRTPPSGLLGHLVPDSESSGIDPIELLRWVHLNLPYRQRRQEEVRVRNYRVHLSDLVPAEADV